MKLLGKMFVWLIMLLLAPFALAIIGRHVSFIVDPWASYFVILCFVLAIAMAIAIVARFILIVAGRIKT